MYIYTYTVTNSRVTPCTSRIRCSHSSKNSTPCGQTAGGDRAPQLHLQVSAYIHTCTNLYVHIYIYIHIHIYIHYPAPHATLTLALKQISSYQSRIYCPSHTLSSARSACMYIYICIYIYMHMYMYTYWQ